MFDSVSLWLDLRPDEAVLGALSDVEKRLMPTGETRYVGRLQNLRVLVRHGGVGVTGSLPKFHLGDNVQVLNRRETTRAIENLSDCLCMPMQEARINRLHIASNFGMREAVNRYLTSLGEARYYERVSYKFGLLYRNSERAMTFYDKAVDLKRHRQTIPNGLDTNLLRYEFKLNRRIAPQLKRRDVTAAMLYDEGVYTQLVDRWRSEYFAISRVHRVRLGVPLMNVKQLHRVLAVEGLKKLGEEAVFSFVEQTELSAMQKYRLRARIRELAKAKDCTEQDGCLSELDSKVNEAVALYR